MYVTSRVGVRPYDVKSQPVTLFFAVKQTKNLLYDRISLRKVSRGTKFREKSRSGGSRFQTCDVTLLMQSDWPAKICARGSKTVWAVSQTLPPRIYPERTKRCRGSGLVLRLGQYIPNDDPHWKCFLKLLSLLVLSTAVEVTSDSITDLKMVVESYLFHYNELYFNSMTPKMHYLLHLPEQMRW